MHEQPPPCGEQVLVSSGQRPVLLRLRTTSGKPRAMRVLCSGKPNSEDPPVRSQPSLPAMTYDLFKTRSPFNLSTKSKGDCSSTPPPLPFPWSIPAGLCQVSWTSLALSFW